MFRKDLQRRLQGIFGFEKVTFDAPSESFEQDTLFVEVNESLSRVRPKKETARVSGFVTVYSQNNKLPFGFFNKKLEQASAALKKDLFFYDIDVNPANSQARFQNIHERRANFIFLYSGQYDPNQGQLTSLVFD